MIKQKKEGFIMRKNELPKEVNDYMDEYIKTHTIKNMDDMQEMMRNLFGPALQKMLDAEMESKLGYSKMRKKIPLIVEMVTTKNVILILLMEKSQ